MTSLRVKCQDLAIVTEDLENCPPGLIYGNKKKTFGNPSPNDNSRMNMGQEEKI